MSATGIDFAAGLCSYLAARGHELRGHEIRVSCPFHEDENPSCRIDTDRGVFHCDPCGAGGGALDLVAALEACDRPTAMRILSGDHAVSTPPPTRPTAAPPSAPDLRGTLADYRASLRAAGAKPALDWLSKSWNVSRAVLDGYGVGLGPTVRVQTDRGTVETFSLAIPSFREGALVGIKLYRPRWRELAGDRPGKVISERGSKPALVAGHLLGDAADRTVLVVGGEKDALIAASALPEMLVVAHAGGEGAWAAPKRATTEDRARALATEILAAGPARVVLALDANEAERGLPEAVGAFTRAGAALVHFVAWPDDFVAKYPKGGAAQFLLDPSFGAVAFRTLIETAVPVETRPAAPSSSPAQESTAMDSSQTASSGATEQPRRRKPVIVSLEDVESKPVNWLWKPRIALGKLTLLQGNPKSGKTFIALGVAAMVSRGWNFKVADQQEHPDREPANVLFMTAEDSLEDTIKPRLVALGADTSRVKTVTGWEFSDDDASKKKVRALTLQDLDVLEEALAEIKPALLVVDPIQAWLGPKVDMSKAEQVRPVLAGLYRLAEKYQCAAVVIQHLSKASTSHAIFRGLGSIDLPGAARSVLLAGRDPRTGKRALVNTATNCAREAPAIGYEISGEDPGTLVWTGASDVTAADILAPEPVSQGGGKTKSAVEFLKGKVANGPADSKTVEQEAKQHHGITLATLKRAKDELGLVSFCVGHPGGGRGAKSWFYATREQEAAHRRAQAAGTHSSLTGEVAHD